MTFHSVRRRHTEELGLGGELTLPDDVFDNIIARLAADGYNCITCGELFSHLQDEGKLPTKPLLLSFDDGYLDNWTFVAPILRRHRMKGVVFVATDFIDPSTELRNSLERTEKPPERGYLNAAELRALDSEGVLEVQSHSARHSRLPISNEILDYHRPKQRNQWLERNVATPEQLAGEHSGATAGLVPWGTPVFRSEWSSAAQALFTDDQLAEKLSQHVESNGGADFFTNNNWREQLDRMVLKIGVSSTPETHQENQLRVCADLKSAKQQLEEILGHQVPFLAWPGGGCSKESVRWAIEEVGHLATFGTNKCCHGVTPSIRAIPRAYFRQNYRGRHDLKLRADLCRSIIDWEAGDLRGYLRGFITRRRMSIHRDSNIANNPRRPD